MKKGNENDKKQSGEIDDIAAEIAQLFREVGEMEYRGILYEQELVEAKGKYWHLLMRLERTIFSEEERKELEAQAESIGVEIDTTEQKLHALRESVASLRARLERVHAVDEAKRKKKAK